MADLNATDRSTAGVTTAMIVRDEAPDDAPLVDRVHRRAFDGPDEAALVRLLRTRGKAPVSLVVEEDGAVIGHIMFSRITFDPPAPEERVFGLAPVGVLPEHQRRGAGRLMIETGLARCRAAGSDAVVVLGDPAYYRRFGFRTAGDFGIGNEYGADDAFMVLALTPDALSRLGGTARYEPEFAEIAC